MLWGIGNAVYTTDYLSETVEHKDVSFGTQPLVRNETVEGVLEIHLQKKLSFSLATVIMDNPYAPLIRDSDGRVTGSLKLISRKLQCLIVVKQILGLIGPPKGR